ncbi:hypothetical protein KDL01_02315 [Actinospica durhamensis]|uniref:Outer membrane channel protein CpnT-like N-terminal domain-containing protein n=1 Tax=Actinospica durhamensis TaxID=1508375 RepID=A0A941EJN2_9ACTN|nr:hypothetical protein [Actinospica durhamensis]MBR7832073.1 hypothetical protein [Actinospica durhamensis]
MSVVLPNELVWVLGAIGVVWPNVDEDELRSIADQFRQAAGDLEDQHAGAMQAVEQMLGVNSGESLEIFQALWSKVSGQHLKDLGEGIKVLAEAISIGADIIEGMKVAAIAEFVAFVAQTAAVAAESVATLGLGAGAEAVVVDTTRTVVKGIFDQAIAQVGQQLKQAMMAPVLSTLTAAAENLGEQLLGDALGVTQGVDLSAVADAAETGGEKSLSTLTSQLRETVGDPAGQVGALLGGEGLQTEQHTTDTASKISDILAGRPQ